jgi:hypothetical protein
MKGQERKDNTDIQLTMGTRNRTKKNKTELEKNERPRKNGQYRYTVNNGYMKQNEEKLRSVSCTHC